ncbi:MAG: hypothetical protein WEC83_00475 [Patescibacteria group bacterium]
MTGEKQFRALAELISTVTNPAIVFVVSLGFITYRYAETNQEFLTWTAIGTLLLVGPGIAYTLSTWRKEKRVDIDITKREDRIVPLMLASLGALFGGYLIATRLQNDNLLLMSNILVAMLVSLTIITSQWKISLHSATYAALTTLLTIFAAPYFAVLYVGLLAIGWARITLRQHTMAQVIGGSLIGVGITTAITLLFRS